METKKHLKKDVRTKRTLFTQIGMVIAISACLWAFSWQRTLHEDILPQTDEGQLFVYQGIDAPRIEVEKPKLEAPNPPSHSINNIVVVENEVPIGEEEQIEETPPELLDIPIGNPENLNILPPISQTLEYFPAIDPEFPGGEKAQKLYMQRYASIYNDGRYNGERKIVTIAFTVQTNGNITDIKVLKSFNEEATNAVISAFEKMPKWVPGVNQKGQIAPVRVTMPIYFDFRKL